MNRYAQRPESEDPETLADIQAAQNGDSSSAPVAQIQETVVESISITEIRGNTIDIASVIETTGTAIDVSHLPGVEESVIDSGSRNPQANAAAGTIEHVILQPPIAPAVSPASPAANLSVLPVSQESVDPGKFMALLGCSVSWYGKFIQQAPPGTPLLLTYSFMHAVPDYFNERLYRDSPDAYRISGFQAFNEAQKTEARHVFDMVAQATGISFLEVPDTLGGEIRLGMHDMAGRMAGYAYAPGVDDGISNDDPLSLDNLSQQGVSGDIFLSRGYLGNSTLAPGTDGFVVLMHEIGHALGLGHPTLTAEGLTTDEDNRNFTVMAEKYDGPMPTTYRPYDLAALRYLYGTDAHEEEASAGIVSTFDGASMTFSANASGSLILGTDLVDHMNGGNGSDALYGRGGNDILDGTEGNDTLDGGIGNDTIMGSSGNDQLQGSWGADWLDGGPGSDLLYGGDGSDILVGSGDGDTLIGGDWAPAGVPDTADYRGASGAVRVLLNTSYETGSTDLHFDGTRGHSYNIGSGQVADMSTQDRLININRVVGTKYDDFLSDSGWNYDETLIGGEGNDTLVSHGGGNWSYSTHDTLIGGTGDDIYVLAIYTLSNAGTDIVETTGEGCDTIEIPGGSAVFGIPENVENLLGGDWAQLNVTGNASDNRIVSGYDQDTLSGASGNDTLDGGFANDVLAGGSGDDTLIGNGGADTMTGGQGADSFGFNYLLVQPERDLITDFHPEEGDRIVLYGSLTYQFGSGNDGTALIFLSDGESILLMGQTPTQVSPDWFIHAL